MVLPKVADGIATGNVVRNDQRPERVGRELLQDFKKDKSKDETWRGQVYGDKQGEYKKSGISLSDAGLMEINVKVGFMRRTIQWTSVEEIPSVTNYMSTVLEAQDGVCQQGCHAY